jgi:hypothetical protein
MHEAIRDRLVLPASTFWDVLTGIVREGAQRMPAQAIDAEVAEWIESYRELRDQASHRQVVRNGRLPKRTILSGVGPIEADQPRVLDRRPKSEAEPFSSKILPPYLRETKSLEELIPGLYVKGVSTGDFSEALPAFGRSKLARCCFRRATRASSVA